MGRNRQIHGDGAFHQDIGAEFTGFTQLLQLSGIHSDISGVAEDIIGQHLAFFAHRVFEDVCGSPHAGHHKGKVGEVKQLSKAASLAHDLPHSLCHDTAGISISPGGDGKGHLRIVRNLRFFGHVF